MQLGCAPSQFVKLNVIPTIFAQVNVDYYQHALLAQRQSLSDASFSQVADSKYPVQDANLLIQPPTPMYYVNAVHVPDDTE